MLSSLLIPEFKGSAVPGGIIERDVILKSVPVELCACDLCRWAKVLAIGIGFDFML